MSNYQQGLSPIREDVFSEHYLVKEIHKLLNFTNIESKDYVEQQTRSLDQSELKRFIAITKNASEIHISDTTKRIGDRINKKIGNNVDYVEAVIREVIGDRQFMKGPKSNVNWLDLSHKVKKSVMSNADIECVIVGLPFKMPTILKCPAQEADFAEASFILQLSEFCSVLKRIILAFVNHQWTADVKFTIVCDGHRFNQIVGCEDHAISIYTDSINLWINYYELSQTISVVDYVQLVQTQLSLAKQEEKKKLRQAARLIYSQRLGRIVYRHDLCQRLKQAVLDDPDPESENASGRFASLFQSMLFTMRFRCIERYALNMGCNYQDEYIRRIHDVVLILKGDISALNTIPDFLCSDSEIDDVLTEAWCATIDYIAEIRSDRDMDNDIIQCCYPRSLRWTIHAKKGQIGLNCSGVNGLAIWPWHGVAVLMPSKHNLKQYNMPYSMVCKPHYLRVTTQVNDVEHLVVNIPSEHGAQSNVQLLDHLATHYTRRISG